MSAPPINLPFTDSELNECPIEEKLYIITIERAAELFHNPIESLESSFINFLHLEHIHHIFQRCSPSKFILLSPNIAAELFTWEQCYAERNYIAKRLIGAQMPGVGRIEGLETLWRQTYRKIWQFDKDNNAPHKLYFMYDREPNCIIKLDGQPWSFAPKSPIYQRLKKLHATFKKQIG